MFFAYKIIWMFQKENIKLRKFNNKNEVKKLCIDIN